MEPKQVTAEAIRNKTYQSPTIKQAIINQLGYGQENAITKDQLSKRLGIGERKLRLAIRELIDEGQPVCGSTRPPYGYYIANTPEEIAGELRLLRSYGMELLRRYSTLRKIKASMLIQHPGQLTLNL